MSRDVWLDANGKYLHVPAKLGRLLKIKLHRPLVGMPVTAHLVLRADGHWYALIVCETLPQDEQGIVHPEQGACEHPVVGLDVGLKVFLADSAGDMVENPRRYRRGQKSLARAQRTMCRRKKGSHRRRKASREVACKHLKVSRQRRDFHFKTAKRFAERYSRICVEDLNITGMVKNQHLAKSIYDASWSAFLGVLEDKAERAGHRFVRVPARFTTQQCSRCGECVQKSLFGTDASLPHLRTGRGPRRECRQEHFADGITGGGTAFRDGSRWAAGRTEKPPALAVGSCHGTFLNTLAKVETPPKLLSGQNTIAALPMMLERATSPKLRESPCAARLSFMM